MTDFTLQTTVVRAGIDDDPTYGAVTPPLHLSSTFTFAQLGQKRPYDYTRSGNPTRDQLGDALAALEDGAGGVVTSSGMAAVTLVLASLLGPGDRFVYPHDCYGGTHRLVEALAPKLGFEAVKVDCTDLEALAEALGDKAALLWLETPSNPLLRITDLAAASALARRAGAAVAVDNTFLSPALQRPIEHGADYVVHSTTKYLNGHSDVVGGVVIARDEAGHEQLTWWANCLGITGAPFDSFLTLRGLRTLSARLAVHQANTEAVIAAALRHPAVAAIHYPGLADHPGHALAARQQDGFGAMLSLELVGGLAAARAFCDGLDCFSLAQSLGGVESLVAHPATMTHAAMTSEARAEAGIGDGLVRLSVGIEAEADLVADLHRALDRAALHSCREQAA